MLGGDHERAWWEGSGTDAGSVEAELIVAMAFFLLSFFVVTLWVLPRLINRSAVRIPSRVPKEWVADFDAEDR